MDDSNLTMAPSLNPIQLAWLQEIGLDRHMLARWAVPQAPQAPQSTQPAQPVQQLSQAQQPPPEPPVTAVLPGPKITEILQAPKKPALTPLLPSSDLPLDLPAEWPALQAHAQVCQRCDLHINRDSVVFGAGVVIAPELMIIGEAPGASDDQRGLPFQGKPGQLLQAMLSSIQLSLPAGLRKIKPSITDQDADPSASIYCTNVIKCRPLGNTTPSAAEIAACTPYLLAQIEFLQPKRILTLGHLAAQVLLQVDSTLPKLRGQVHQWRSPSGRTIPLVASWHPATLLLHPQHKADVWYDLNLIHNLPD